MQTNNEWHNESRQQMKFDTVPKEIKRNDHEHPLCYYGYEALLVADICCVTSCWDDVRAIGLHH